MWCIPQVDGNYVARMEDVLDLYAEAPDPKRPGFSITNGITSLLSGVASTVEGGVTLSGAGGADAAALAGTVSGALGIASGIVGALSGVALAFYEAISSAIHGVQFTHQFEADANKLGVTGGDEESNDPDPNTAATGPYVGT